MCGVGRCQEMQAVRRWTGSCELMDDVLDESLSRRYPEAVADTVRGADALTLGLSRRERGHGEREQLVEDLLWFVLKAFVLLAIFQIVCGVLDRNPVILTTGFYSSATIVYVAGLLVACQESVRPADQRYPYGYGNRAAMFQLVSFCVLGVANIYLLFCVLASREASLGRIDLATFLTPAAGLGICILVYKKVQRASQEAAGENLQNVDMVLKGAITVSAVALAAVLWRQLFGDGLVAPYGSILITIATLCLFVKGFHDTFLVITDRSVIGRSVRNLAGLVQRAAREAHVVDVKTRNVGDVTHVEVRAAFPRSYTIAKANAIERDIEHLLRRKVRKVGQVRIYWQG